jgi:hypothetical protein
MGISIIFLIFSFSLSNIIGTILFIISEIFFWGGVAMMFTIEGKQMKELGVSTRIVDILLGRIPRRTLVGDVSIPLFKKSSLLISGALLVIFSVFDYIILQNALNNDLPMLVTGVVIIIYSLVSSRTKCSNS